MEGADIINDTIQNLSDIGFSYSNEVVSSPNTSKISVKKAVSKEEEIRDVLLKHLKTA